MQLSSWQFILFEIIYAWKITFEFLTFEIWIFQTTLDEKNGKTKVIDLKKLQNFVVELFHLNLFMVSNTYFKIG
jgi:hypothetical protein